MNQPRNYYRIRTGRNAENAKKFYDGQFIAGGWGINLDLAGRFPENRLPEKQPDFNRVMIPIYLEKNPGKTRIGAGSCCGMLHTLCKVINKGDIVLCPNGTGSYWVGEVQGDYYFADEGDRLFHRRKVQWCSQTIDSDEMSQALKNSTDIPSTVVQITKYADEIDRLLSGQSEPTLVSNDATVEDPSVFALEKHLEAFLVENWGNTELGKGYDIFEADGELVGQQYQSDTGPIDILAISKDKKTLLVVELKKGRASDVAIGQIQRYMGYVLEELAEENQAVKGVIIALEDDVRLQRALKVTSNIDFYKYQVSFKLFKA